MLSINLGMLQTPISVLNSTHAECTFTCSGDCHTCENLQPGSCACLQAVVNLEQRVFLEELATLMTSAEGRLVTATDAKTWTLEQWTQELFPVIALIKHSCSGELSDLTVLKISMWCSHVATLFNVKLAAKCMSTIWRQSVQPFLMLSRLHAESLRCLMDCRST